MLATCLFLNISFRNNVCVYIYLIYIVHVCTHIHYMLSFLRTVLQYSRWQAFQKLLHEEKRGGGESNCMVLLNPKTQSHLKKQFSFPYWIQSTKLNPSFTSSKSLQELKQFPFLLLLAPSQWKPVGFSSLPYLPSIQSKAKNDCFPHLKISLPFSLAKHCYQASVTSLNI